MKKYVIGAGIVVIAGFLALVLFGGKKAVHQSIQPTKTYVALGDSVAAGVGLMNDSDSSACNRTNEAYPHLVANALNYKLTTVACSGATLTEGILGKQDVNDLLVSPQLEQLYALPKPDLMSITIGANDVGWTNIIAKCYTSECGTDSDTAAIQANLMIVQTNLQSTLAQIQTYYGAKPPHVIVTGYHQVFPGTVAAGCLDLTGIDTSELAWGRQVQADINTTIKAAVSDYSFATYVPVDFSGHELCTADPWVQGLSDKQPYHPTEAGQTAFAKQIISSVRGQK